jgi:transcriptional regulator with XRE-family HTH domain
MAAPETLIEPASIAPLVPANGTEVRRRELAGFVRSRRERMRPEQVGLPLSRRRRTPGLRREEVAQLAGVGITWYTWLEQGRDINPSAQVLDAIARTLQLDVHERTHLFTLAGMATISDQCLHMCPTAQPLIDQLEPYPAAIVNARLDLLGFNRVYGSFYDNLDTIPIEDRNVMWLAFTDPLWRKVIVDWDEVIPRMVAEFRAAMAEHLGEPAWTTLVARLERAAPEFTAHWERHDVQGIEGTAKRALHPTVGLLSLVYTNLWLSQGNGTRIIAFTPGDERTQKRLERLHESLDT